MNSLEAMTRLLSLAEVELRRNETYGTETPELSESEQELATATAVITAMLNTALPIARFRVFVEVDPIQPKVKSVKERPVVAEFTGCAVTVGGVRSAIQGLSIEATNVRIMLFEQRHNGAEMISAYQGKTKTLAYRNWLKELDLFNSAMTIQ
jgi:hypothetical protein